MHKLLNRKSHIHIDTKQQLLSHYCDDKLLSEYQVSTAKNGIGNYKGSYCTPSGWHIIRAKIGASLPIDSVFVGRRPTNEIYTSKLYADNPDRDWILTRIMWLSGLELGANRLGNYDTMQRYIYIHGAPDEKINNSPNSKGCINMRSQDIIRLFNEAPIGTTVFIDGR